MSGARYYRPQSEPGEHAPAGTSRESTMNRNRWIRQIHRWLSIAFTLFVIANFAVMGRETIALWVGTATLVPLALLLLTGLYLFALPYLDKSRREQRSNATTAATE